MFSVTPLTLRIFILEIGATIAFLYGFSTDVLVPGLIELLSDIPFEIGSKADCIDDDVEDVCESVDVVGFAGSD